MIVRSFLPPNHELSDAAAAVGNCDCAKALRFSRGGKEGARQAREKHSTLRKPRHIPFACGNDITIASMPCPSTSVRILRLRGAPWAMRRISTEHPGFVHRHVRRTPLLRAGHLTQGSAPQRTRGHVVHDSPGCGKSNTAGYGAAKHTGSHYVPLNDVALRPPLKKEKCSWVTPEEIKALSMLWCGL
jgi:hypothetical protein